MKIKNLSFTKSLKTILFTALWCVCSLNAQAQTGGDFGQDNTLHWEFNSGTGTLTISGTGAIEDYYSSDQRPWDSYITGITAAVIESGVTSNGNRAFFRCENLTSVTIPNSVTSIGKHTFADCSSLTDVIIPGSVKSLGYGAFDCRSLTDITVATENTAYYSKDGVLFNNDKTVFCSKIWRFDMNILSLRIEISDLCYYSHIKTEIL